MILETDNLLIRPFESADSDDVFDYMSDSNVTCFLPQGVLSEDEVIDFITENAKVFAITMRDTGKLVGHIEFFPYFGEHTYEIGWTINPSFQRRGIAYEAASAVLGHGFRTLGIHRVVATAQPENKPSYGLMEKLGMVREGHFRQCIPKRNGVWWDEYFYAMLLPDYESKYDE